MHGSRSPLQENIMADDQKPSAKDKQAQDLEQTSAPIKDLPQQDVSKDADQVKGGKKTNWDIPEGTASPSA
jgi:hypothetical protein